MHKLSQKTGKQNKSMHLYENTHTSNPVTRHYDIYYYRQNEIKTSIL